MSEKNSKSKTALITILASLVVLSTATASLMTGCGDNSEATEDEVVVGTSIVSKTIEGTYYVIDDEGSTIVVENGTDAEGNIIVQNGTDPSGKKIKVENGTDPSGNKVIEIGKKSSDSKSQKSEPSEVKEDSKGDSDNNQSSKSEQKDESSQGKSDKDNDNNDPLKIDGKSFAVGDTVTCVYELSSPEKLENFQAKVVYDGNYLSVEDAYLEGQAEMGSILNYDLKDEIRFNGSYINGYNFGKYHGFLTVKYRVKSGGSYTPKFVWEVATGVSGKAYVADDEATGGLDLTCDYS